jgi:hypothetical protein
MGLRFALAIINVTNSDNEQQTSGGKAPARQAIASRAFLCINGRAFE